MDFSSLGFSKDSPKKVSVGVIDQIKEFGVQSTFEPLDKSKVKKIVAAFIPQSTTKLDFQKDILKRKPKLTKEELRILEPGYKIPVANFLQIGKWCEECEDVEAHVHSPDTRRFRCLKCKTITYYNKN